ncbi:hypothetical protein [Acetobacter sp. P5B1]|uniref:hypothetical protein n=1 Tax=Acetobacter sp. P5B1 TaxID=2762620 RepID=UPI001C03F713|nr:hypothetical protein [Acetobacter sp. P5B1]
MAESFCTMPDPLTPADCDLRGYDFMPFYGVRYFRSSSYMQAAARNPRAGLAAMKLWWEAWSQVPCGSLPDDDIELGMLADFGTDHRAWAKAKEIALRGFVKCSDGRLYHKELCEIALDKFDLRLKSDEKRESDRERLKAWRAKQKNTGNQPNIETKSETDNETQTETVSETPGETDNETRFVAGKRVESRDISSLRSDVGCNAPDAPPEKPMEDRWQELGEEVIAAAGTDPSRSMVQTGGVRQWLADARAVGYGYDGARDIILGVVREKAKYGGRGKPPAWFDKPVSDAIRTGTISASGIQREPAQKPKSRYQQSVEIWDNVPDIEGV